MSDDQAKDYTKVPVGEGLKNVILRKNSREEKLLNKQIQILDKHMVNVVREVEDAKRKFTSQHSPTSAVCIRWCLHDTGMNFIPERLAWFVSRLHGRSHSGMKML